jgi:hypothetical protein
MLVADGVKRANSAEPAKIRCTQLFMAVNMS